MFQAKPAASGIEIMLKNIGLGPIIDMAQQLANEKTVEKILKFADGLDELNARLDRIERILKSHGELAPDDGNLEPGANPGGPSGRVNGAGFGTAAFAEPSAD